MLKEVILGYDCGDQHEWICSVVTGTPDFKQGPSNTSTTRLGGCNILGWIPSQS